MHLFPSKEVHRYASWRKQSCKTTWNSSLKSVQGRIISESWTYIIRARQLHNLSIWFLSYCPFCRILPATSCTELNWPASLMKKKEKHTFFSTSMKLKSKQKIAIIFKSKWNNENVKNFLNVKKKRVFYIWYNHRSHAQK